jgi:hypothetical protein
MYVCLHCSRSYQRKLYYDRHFIVCELHAKTKKERTLENEEWDDTPSVRKLYLIVMELAAQNKQLTQKVAELEKAGLSKKTKLNILDWLNQTAATENIETYDAWLEQIPAKINRAHLEQIFDHDYVGGMVAILKGLTTGTPREPRLGGERGGKMGLTGCPRSEKSGLTGCPRVGSLRAFSNKDNVLYGFYGNEWRVVDLAEFKKVMFILDKYCMLEFVKWQTENSEQMYRDDFAVTYAQNMKKIMGGNSSREQLYARVKKEIYMYLRCEPPNVVEYEIAF